ncbi:LysR family transcriptional regulator [Streptomyces sp. KR80]|uniref:LysR family transcriptional regulator n=1 Tax=Streptomyces sp. KR80 TaxID=3457426 RepID=UPI003FD45CB8
MDLLRQLHYFTVVAEEMHFGRAAERLGIAQPPLSQRIRGLENHLGVRLFDRSRRQIRLTAAGAALIPEAHQILARVARARELVVRADRGTHGTVHLGVVPELPGRLLAALLTEFAAVAPGVRLELHELTTAEQLNGLGDRMLDAGVLDHSQPASDELRCGPPIELPLGVVLPRASPLAGRARIDVAELTGKDLVLAPHAAAPALHDAVLAYCLGHGVHPGQISEARNPEVMLGLVIAGYGIAFSHPAIAQKEPRVVWRQLTPDAPCQRLCCAAPATGPHPAVASLLDTATEVLLRGGAADPPPALGATSGDTPGEGGEPRPWNVVFQAR